MFAVRVYQQLAPQRVRDRCLFAPTCSDYALLALFRFGSVRGTWLAWRRIRRCCPPNGGHDPVPEERT